MFIDQSDPWRDPPEQTPPLQPAPHRRRLTRRGKLALGWILVLNFTALVLGLLAGSRLLHALVALLRR